jgi:hypothetical protein
MTLPYVATDLQEGQERQHRTLIAQSVNELIKVRPPFDTTEAEVSAGVTPVNYAYAPGDVRRYGAAIDGATDDRPAIMNAYEQFKSSGAPITAPAGTSYVSKDGANAYALLFDGDVSIDGQGKFTLVGDDDAYNLIRIEGGTNVDIVLKGIKFDHGATSPDAAATDHICVRIESSINTIRIEDLDMVDYEGDGIYLRADVNGPGGYIKNVTASNAGRSVVTIAKGERIRVIDCVGVDIGLQAFQTAPAADTTVLRNIDFINCSVFGGGDFGGAFDTTDRAGFFIKGVSGAAVDVQGSIRVIDCRAYDYGNDAPGTVPLAMGIEVREIFGTVVQNFNAQYCRDVGIYSYLNDATTVRGCFSANNDIGLWMNDCTRYTEESNTCIDNTTANRNYSGPDGDTTYLNASGLNTVLARGSVSFSGGTPSLNSAYNVSIDSDLGVGDVRFAFDVDPADADYTVIATFRSNSGTSGLIQSASHTTTTFRVVTLTAGVAADEAYDFIVIGVPTLTTEP